MKNLLTSLSKPCLECGGEAHYKDGGAFSPHLMYNPETGEPVEVATPEEHAALAEQGFIHEAEMNRMAAGGQHMQNGMESMQKNINSHFKKMSKNRNNMFKDATAPMNQDTDSYGALKLDNFKSYVKQNVEDVMLQEALQSYTDAKGKIDMFGIEAAMGTQPQGQMPQQPIAAYGGGNFGMGNSNFDITPWAGAYGQQLQENAFNRGALGSMLQTGAENIANNYFNPQYKTKTKTKLLFNQDLSKHLGKEGIEGGDWLEKGTAKTDRHGKVKREKDWVDEEGNTQLGAIKMHKDKIHRDYFSPGRRQAKKDYRAYKKNERVVKDNNARNASNQAIFDSRLREQVGEEGDLSNVDMTTLGKDMNELLINPYNMSNYNWKDQFDLYNRQYGGVPEQYGGGVNPYLEMYHRGGNLPSHNHSGSAMDMSDMVDRHGQQIWLQGYSTSDPSDVTSFKGRNQVWNVGRANKMKRYQVDPDFRYTHRNFSPRFGGGDPIKSWDGEGVPKIPGVTGYWSVTPGAMPSNPEGVFQYNAIGSPEGFDEYWENRADYIPGAAAPAPPVEKKKTTTSNGKKKSAAEVVETIEEDNTKSTIGGDGYEKGVNYEWDGEKMVPVKGGKRGNVDDDVVDNGGNNQGGNGLYIPDQYGNMFDPRMMGNYLFKGAMRNMRPRRGAMPIAYNPENTFLSDYEYKTKTGLLGRALGLGPRKERTRMHFNHYNDGDAPVVDAKDNAEQVVTNENANLGTIQAAPAAEQKALLEADLNAQRADVGLRPRGNDEFGRIDGSEVYTFGQEKYGGPQYFPEQFPQAAMYPVQQYGGVPFPEQFPNAMPIQQYGGVPFPEQFPQAVHYPQYNMGGEYDLTEEEVAQILAAGGQIEYI